ncbi:MAG: hypothetical protein RLY16_1310 [Bacteroidota bacterium]
MQEYVLRSAVIADLPAILALLNSAYRGERSQQGWTTEAHLIDGEVRTNLTQLQTVFQQSGSTFMVVCNSEKEIVGSVNLQQKATKLYLGMLAVNPLIQNAGIGKMLLGAAVQLALDLHCTSIYMTVISARVELIAWYQRHGYVATGERIPFQEDGISGKHKQALDFVVLEKQIQ